MSSARRIALVLAAAASVALAGGPTARADGDPASDFLLSQSVFLPFDGKIPTADSGAFAQLVKDAAARGYPIRVALIATRYDLGSVTALWQQPQRYAVFLGQELYFVYRGRLLVVMPNGYGVSKGGKPAPAMSRALAGLAPPAGPGAALTDAAAAAVRRLAHAEGVTLPGTVSAGRHGSQTRDRILIVVAAVVAAALIGAAGLLRRRRRVT